MKTVALAGGVGGAKLADGLAQVLPPDDLTIIVNTADDFEHWGLKISPDLDTVCYTLAGLANPERGWGRINESWNTFENVARLGGEDWFRIGDKDLGTHLRRSLRLRAGDKLSEITQDFCHAWGVQHHILPMSDDAVSTMVHTDIGVLPFQEYFVRQRCQPKVKGFLFAGAERCQPAEGVLDSINNASLVVICPSNPWVSIDPILALPTLRSALESHTVVAVSPIVGGKAIKGPAAKMYAELGMQPSALAVAQHYQELLSGIVIDAVDADQQEKIKALGLTPFITNTVMKTQDDRKQLAEDVLQLGEVLMSDKIG